MNEPLSSLLTAMEILPDGLLIVDARQRIVGCNQRAENLFGYHRGELLDEPLIRLLPPAVRDAHARHVARFDAAHGLRPMEKRPILCGITKLGDRMPLTIGISSVGEGADRLLIAVVRDARSLDDTFKDVKLQAETDPLTGLGNRRYLASRLEACALDAGGRDVALLFLDLDRFKPLNDEYGHEVGDEVLRIVARRLRASLRESDLCVRLGGDEFAVLVSGVIAPDDLERIALKLHAGVSAPIHVRDATVRVGVSIGGAIGSPHGCSDGDQLERADAAMYRAKALGVPYRFDTPARTSAA